MNKKIIVFCLVIIAVLVGVFFITNHRQTTKNNYVIADYKCVEPSLITTTQDASETYSYFSKCMCFVSDNVSEPIGIEIVKSTEFEAQTAEQTVKLCNDNCLDLCKQNLEIFLQEHPDFKLIHRW